MTVRVVVADRSAARFYDADRLGGPLRLFDDLQHPQARLRERDFSSDRAGRVFDHAPFTPGRRSSVPRHATGGEHQWRRHETEVFARQIADVLSAEHALRHFDRMVLMAEPAFLGALRAALSKELRAITVVEIGRDLMHESSSRVEQVVQKMLSCEWTLVKS